MARAPAVLAAPFVLAFTTVWPAAAQTTTSAAGSPTFSKDVAPIVFKHCASCHRPGEIGPMSFPTYESTRPWARAIQQKAVSREMPPWGADPAHSMKMRNDRSLSQQELDTIVAWVKAGAPRGEAADMTPAPTFATGWQLGEPDYVFEMPLEWTIKAEGAEAYLYFYQPIPFTEESWMPCSPGWRCTPASSSAVRSRNTTRRRSRARAPTCRCSSTVPPCRAWWYSTMPAAMARQRGKWPDGWPRDGSGRAKNHRGGLGNLPGHPVEALQG